MWETIVSTEIYSQRWTGSCEGICPEIRLQFPDFDKIGFGDRTITAVYIYYMKGDVIKTRICIAVEGVCQVRAIPIPEIPGIE